MSCAACIYSVIPWILASLVCSLRDHLVRARVTLLLGLERDEHATGVERGIAAAGANTRSDRGDSGILQHGIDDRLLALGHRLKRYVLRGLGEADDQSGVLLGKEALGDDRQRDIR